MIGKAEEVLWPGQRPRSQVALLSPMSPQVWDQPGVFDATNTLVYFKTMSYMGELYAQFFSLLRHNIPADFIEELDLTPAGLKPYKVLYVTAPNVPRAAQANLVQWVKEGGTLVTCQGALLADRYNEPCDVFEKLTGLRQRDTKRPITYKIFSLKRLKGPDPKAPWPKGERGEFCVLGFRSGADCPGARVLGRFLDGSPAILQRDLGRGRILHHAFFPGMSHWGNQFTRMNGWITLPAELAGVQPPVSVEPIPDSWPQVEAPPPRNKMIQDLARPNVPVACTVSAANRSPTESPRQPNPPSRIQSLRLYPIPGCPKAIKATGYNRLRRWSI